jgi:hypothetical protein
LPQLGCYQFVELNFVGGSVLFNDELQLIRSDFPDTRLTESSASRGNECAASAIDLILQRLWP